MFLSYLACLFLTFIYNRARGMDASVSLQSVLGTISQVRLQYVITGMGVNKRLDSKEGRGAENNTRT